MERFFGSLRAKLSYFKHWSDVSTDDFVEELDSHMR